MLHLARRIITRWVAPTPRPIPHDQTWALDILSRYITLHAEAWEVAARTGLRLDRAAELAALRTVSVVRWRGRVGRVSYAPDGRHAIAVRVARWVSVATAADAPEEMHSGMLTLIAEPLTVGIGDRVIFSGRFLSDPADCWRLRPGCDPMLRPEFLFRFTELRKG